MAVLKRGLGLGRGSGGAGASRSWVASGWRWAVAGVGGLVRRHWLFSLALAAAVVPRVVAMLGFLPGILFRFDSFDYLWGAVHVSPNVTNTSGYSLFLWLFRPFHSLVLIVALQHLLGLSVAVMVYVVLRRFGLPAWGATLAAAPVLFGPAQMLLEQFIMPDLLALVLMVAAFAVLLTREAPSVWRSATAGLLIGLSAVVRPTALPVLIFIPVYLLIRRVGWRRAGAALLAGATPVLGYMGWFAAVHGSFNMSNSNGLFLWSRTMSFAKCSVIKPPADLQALCPSRQPGRLAEPVPSKRQLPKDYLWNRGTWAWRDAAPGPVPDNGAFTQRNNTRALRFAISAILAQPVDYAAVVAKDSAQPFVRTNTLRFPSRRPGLAPVPAANLRYAATALEGYTGNTYGLTHLSYKYYTSLQQPYGYLMLKYQRLIYLPGPLFGLIMLAGVGGLLLPRRRTLAGLLLWVSAVVVMLLPTAEAEYTYRYVMPAVPLLCMAAALAFRKPREQQPGGPPAVPAGAGEGHAGKGQGSSSVNRALRFSSGAVTRPAQLGQRLKPGQVSDEQPG